MENQGKITREKYMKYVSNRSKIQEKQEEEYDQ